MVMPQTGRRHDKAEIDDAPEDRGSLFGIVFAPSFWALHFVFIYALAAITCARQPAALGRATIWIGIATVVAVAAIAAVSVPAWREWRKDRNRETDHDSVEGRTHFLAHASLLLAGLSIFATLLQALPALLSASCR